MISIELLLFIASILFLIIYKHLKTFNYWTERGVYSPKPVPFFGNAYKILTFTKHASEVFKELYDQTDEPYLGIFLFDKPFLLLKDPKLIKRILLKDAHLFKDRTIAPSTNNEIFRNFLLMCRGARWKKLRDQVSPLFTSGKLKTMIGEINRVSDELMHHISQRGNPLCVRELYSSFITEATARALFNINTDCLKSDQSGFKKIIRKIFNPSLKTLLLQMLYFVKASWVNYLGFDFVDNTATTFLTRLLNEAIETRELVTGGKSKNIVDVMLQNKKTGDEGFGKNGHVASGLQLLVAGVDTTSTGIAWFTYEMGQNPEIQDRLRSEIIEVLKKYNGEITWEAIHEMKYLDICYLEVLRRHPFVPFVERQAAEDYKVEETGLVIEKGTATMIPLFSLFLDENHFENPFEFNPERFASSNHANTNNTGLVFMPFGAGHRLCLGERFAILATKQVVITTLLHYRLEKCEQTPAYPPKYDPKSTFLCCEGGIPMKFIKIHN
ncbi:unnamed protein product [Phyllotreta striolata]|uniref:Cytochrome P450 n=1 Tax=Phyllotreta striolata TaxID=444603 RepID=A0A9N9XNW1_PHYSR|nr:unnamed protein product [Phyllotreta striolata]